MSLKRIADALERIANLLERKEQYVNANRPWTTDEEVALAEYWKEVSGLDIKHVAKLKRVSEKFKRSPASVARKLSLMRVFKNGVQHGT